MYKILVDQNSQNLEEEVKCGETESEAGVVYTSEYFEQMAL